MTKLPKQKHLPDWVIAKLLLGLTPGRRANAKPKKPRWPSDRYYAPPTPPRTCTICGVTYRTPFDGACNRRACRKEWWARFDAAKAAKAAKTE